MIFLYDEEFMNIKIYDDIPDIREGKPKEIIEIPDIMDAWEFYKSIVRCKECKHWDKLNYEAPKQGWCNDPTLYCDGRWTTPDDFCSYGEREGE